jgi:hypothetical protein
MSDAKIFAQKHYEGVRHIWQCGDKNAGEYLMDILISIILYLFVIVLSMTLGNIFKKTDDSMLKGIVRNETKNRNRHHYPVHNLFRDLRH